MKAKAIVYRGIEFIKLADLPVNQQTLLQHARSPERIKILMDGKILENCIQYGEYTHWFNSVYKNSVAPIETKPAQNAAFQIKIALDKA